MGHANEGLILTVTRLREDTTTAANCAKKDSLLLELEHGANPGVAAVLRRPPTFVQVYPLLLGPFKPPPVLLK